MILSKFRVLEWMKRQRAEERRQSELNPFLVAALSKEKREGHRIAIIARTVAFALIGVLLPFLYPRLDVLYYEFWILVFIALGWVQLWLASVGLSRAELALIFLDLSLMTFQNSDKDLQ